jgi:hypothetical protein
MNVSARMQTEWDRLVAERVAFAKALPPYKSGDVVPLEWNAWHDAFCTSQNRSRPPKYPFPALPFSPVGKGAGGFDHEVVRRHLRQYRHALAEFYELREPFVTWFPPPPAAVTSTSGGGGRRADAEEVQQRQPFEGRRLGYTPPAPPPSPQGHSEAVQRVACVAAIPPH